jgi:hemolysin-activating ACP:hemolysin acyltransferase
VLSEGQQAEAAFGPDEAKHFMGNAASRRIAAVVGDIVTILSRDEIYRDKPLRWLHEMVFPPAALQQCLIAYAVDDTTGIRHPAAVVVWAALSATQKEAAVNSFGWIPQTLDEWLTGSHPHVVVSAGEQSALEVLVERINAKKHAPLDGQS